MEVNWNQLIERYLNNELSAEGKLAFEAEVKRDENLRQELELHQLTRQVIQRTAYREMVIDAQKTAKINLRLRQLALVAGIVLLAVLVLVWWNNRSVQSNTEHSLPKTINKEQKIVMANYLQFDNIDPQYFGFSGESDVFLSDKGVLISVTKHAFELNGKPYDGEALIQWQEVLSAADVVKAGLSTLTGKELLETQGMFSLSAFTPDGKPLKLSKTGVYVQVPVDQYKAGMQLYQGFPTKNGDMDWQHPQALEKIPTVRPMNELDFYPPAFEPALDAMKWNSSTAKRDSLYLSFEQETMSLSEVPQNSVSNKDFKPSQSLLQRKSNAVQKAEFPEEIVKWNFSVTRIDKNYAIINAQVSIKDRWHINAMNLPKGTFGIPTQFTLFPSSDYVLEGKPIEPKPIFMHDQAADEDLAFHINKVNFQQKVKLSTSRPITFSGTFSYQCCDETHCLTPFSGTFSIGIDGKAKIENSNNILTTNHIPPSKVLGFWRKGFEQTNLATVEFEQRMKTVHQTCDPNVLKCYTNGLKLPLWKIDQQVVQLGYPEFKAFADQRIGKVTISDEHQQNLLQFYDEAIALLHEKGKKATLAALQQAQEWNQSMKNEREKDRVRSGLRAAKNKEEEANFNLASVSKQLGKTVGFALNSTTFSAPSQKENTEKSLPVSNTSAPTNVANDFTYTVNIDRLTPGLFSSRQNVDVMLMDKSNKAHIRYSPFELVVNDASQYDRLMLYLFANGVNSFERIDVTNGKLNYSLNDKMQYAAAVFGQNETGYYLKTWSNFTANDVKTVILSSVSEQAFEQQLSALNRSFGGEKASLKTELNYWFKEQKNIVVQQQQKAQQAFRAKLYPTVFPCEVNGQMAVDTIGPALIQVIENNYDEPVSISGGRSSFNQYLMSCLALTDMENLVNGKIVAKLLVDENGKVQQVKFTKELPNCPECSEKVASCLRDCTLFQPAKKDSSSVSSWYTLPITYSSN